MFIEQENVWNKYLFTFQFVCVFIFMKKHTILYTSMEAHSFFHCEIMKLSKQMLLNQKCWWNQTILKRKTFYAHNSSITLQSIQKAFWMVFHWFLQWSSIFHILIHVKFSPTIFFDPVHCAKLFYLVTPNKTFIEKRM